MTRYTTPHGYCYSVVYFRVQYCTKVLYYKVHYQCFLGVSFAKRYFASQKVLPYSIFFCIFLSNLKKCKETSPVCRLWVMRSHCALSWLNWLTITLTFYNTHTQSSDAAINAINHPRSNISLCQTSVFVRVNVDFLSRVHTGRRSVLMNLIFVLSCSDRSTRHAPTKQCSTSICASICVSVLPLRLRADVSALHHLLSHVRPSAQA